MTKCSIQSKRLGIELFVPSKKIIPHAPVPRSSLRYIASFAWPTVAWYRERRKTARERERVKVSQRSHPKLESTREFSWYFVYESDMTAVEKERPLKDATFGDVIASSYSQTISQIQRTSELQETKNQETHLNVTNGCPQNSQIRRFLFVLNGRHLTF